MHDTQSLVAARRYIPVPISNRGIRKPILDWTMEELAERVEYAGRLLRAIGLQHRTLQRVLGKMKPKQTVREVWDRLSEGEQAEISRIGGIKSLAG